jgi:hypothetical protein
MTEHTHMTELNLPRCRLFFWYAKSHPQLQAYLRLRDTRCAANQDWLRTAKVIKIRTEIESTRQTV